MTPKKKWLSVLQGVKPDRVPVDYWATDEVTFSLMCHFGTRDLKDVYEKLHIDAAISVNPEYVGPDLPENEDVFGCKYLNVHYGSGFYRECVYHPLSEFESAEEIDKHYSWPHVDLYDYSVIPELVARWENYPLKGGGSEPFLVYKKLRGQEQAYIDLFRKPEMVHYCLDQMFDFCYENTSNIYREVPGKITFSGVNEDFGHQTGLLVSPDMIREFFLQRMKRMIDLAHSNGVYVFFHSDGAIREIIPDMIEIGIDILNPIQWRCTGMDRDGLKRDFGEKVVFHGGMDNQYTIPFGSEEEVRKEVEENLNILGENGGYILAPCHNIQPITPIKNILAMYDEAYKRASNV